MMLIYVYIQIRCISTGELQIFEDNDRKFYGCQSLKDYQTAIHETNKEAEAGQVIWGLQVIK